MDHSKKMVLISHDALKRIKNSESTSTDMLSMLDKDMKSILNSKANDRDKWVQYQQVLQRYLSYVFQSKNPIQLPIVEEKMYDDNDNDGIDKKLTATKEEVKDEKDTDLKKYSDQEDIHIKDILSAVPKTYQNKARLLLKKIKPENGIQWDEQGRVLIQGNVIKNSNIIDLVNDFSRPRKQPPPPGWKEFAEALKKINIPMEFIGNPERKKYIEYQDVRFTTSTPKIKRLQTRYNVTVSDYEAGDESVLTRAEAKRKKRHKKHSKSAVASSSSAWESLK